MLNILLKRFTKYINILRVKGFNQRENYNYYLLLVF